MKAHGHYCGNSLLQLQKNAIPEGHGRGGSLYRSHSDGALSPNTTEEQILFQAGCDFVQCGLSFQRNICFCGCTKYFAYSLPKPSHPTLRCIHYLLFVNTSSHGLKLFPPWLTSEYSDECNCDVFVLKYNNKYT
jgi:hypothetical protein